MTDIRNINWYIEMIGGCEYWAGYYAALYSTSESKGYSYRWQFERHKKIANYLRSRIYREYKKNL